MSDVASNGRLATDPIYADRDGTAHSTDSGEGVTPAGPFFSRPAPQSLIRQAQRHLQKTAHLQTLAAHQQCDNFHLKEHKAQLQAIAEAQKIMPAGARSSSMWSQVLASEGE